MRKLIALVGLLLACGGEDNSSDIQPYADEEQAVREGLPPLSYWYEGELGTTEQAFGARKGAQFAQFGTRSSTSGLACNLNTAGQVCMILRGVTGTLEAKNLNWRFTPSHQFTATELTAVRNAVVALDNTLAFWTLTETPNAPSAPVQIGKGTVSGSSSSNNIDAFRQVDWQLPQDLTEGAGVVGSYKHATNVIVIDIADINARGALQDSLGGSGEVGKLRTHAIVSGFLTALGAGTRDDAASVLTYHDRTLVFPGPAFRPLTSAGADCQLERFDHFDNGQYNVLTPNCGD